MYYVDLSISCVVCCYHVGRAELKVEFLCDVMLVSNFNIGT